MLVLVLVETFLFVVLAVVITQGGSNFYFDVSWVITILKIEGGNELLKIFRFKFSLAKRTNNFGMCFSHWTKKSLCNSVTILVGSFVRMSP